MKINRILYVLMLFVGSQLFFACGTAKYYDFGASSTAHREAKKAEAKTEPAQAENASAITQPAAENVTVTKKHGNVYLEASAAETTPSLSTAKIHEIEPTENVQTPALLSTGEAIAHEPAAPAELKNTSENKKQKKGLFAGIKAIKATVLEIILAIFLPPVAVAIHEGITLRFWLTILLWILGILPGIIFALLVVTDSI